MIEHLEVIIIIIISSFYQLLHCPFIIFNKFLDLYNSIAIPVALFLSCIIQKLLGPGLLAGGGLVLALEQAAHVRVVRGGHRVQARVAVHQQGAQLLPQALVAQLLLLRRPLQQLEGDVEHVVAVLLLVLLHRPEEPREQLQRGRGQLPVPHFEVAGEVLELLDLLHLQAHQLVLQRAQGLPQVMEVGVVHGVLSRKVQENTLFLSLEGLQQFNCPPAVVGLNALDGLLKRLDLFLLFIIQLLPFGLELLRCFLELALVLVDCIFNTFHQSKFPMFCVLGEHLVEQRLGGVQVGRLQGLALRPGAGRAAVLLRAQLLRLHQLHHLVRVVLAGGQPLGLLHQGVVQVLEVRQEGEHGVLVLLVPAERVALQADQVQTGEAAQLLHAVQGRQQVVAKRQALQLFAIFQSFNLRNFIVEQR
mmetsp:Transcript_21555/g.32534  ORF Transcript_21555/g.32534 Transcript_21555/m.32534 type:complete len:418 (+) Transcript_21555:213-1466(+)